MGKLVGYTKGVYPLVIYRISEVSSMRFKKIRIIFIRKSLWQQAVYRLRLWKKS